MAVEWLSPSRCTLEESSMHPTNQPSDMAAYWCSQVTRRDLWAMNSTALCSSRDHPFRSQQALEAIPLIGAGDDSP